MKKAEYRGGVYVWGRRDDRFILPKKVVGSASLRNPRGILVEGEEKRKS